MTKKRNYHFERPLTLDQLQEILNEFEAEYWNAPKDEEGKTKHINLHLSKLMGKMADVTERREHNLKPDTAILKSEVIPDLLYYALSLAAAHEIDLQEKFLERLDANKKRVAGWAKKRYNKLFSGFNPV